MLNDRTARIAIVPEKPFRRANRFAEITVFRACLPALFLLCAVPTAGQQPKAGAEPIPPAQVARLKQVQQATLGSDYAYKQLAYLTRHIGPRLSGSPQAERAVAYVAGEMRRLGLDVRLEKVMVPHWVRGLETGELVAVPGGAPGTAQKIVLTALGGSVATPTQGLTAPVLIVPDFDALRALPRSQVQGRIVLFDYHFDKAMAAQGAGGEAYGQAFTYRVAGPSAAARMGAAACLIRSIGGADFRLPHTGVTRYAPDAPRIPAAAVTAEDADLMAGLAEDGAPVTLHLTLTPQTLPDVASANVVGDLKGTEHPEQVVIVSGHLDSWDLGTGAIDDGAGVVMALQTAQILQQLHLRPRRTIRVVAWMNEENGGMGARTYAKDHAGDIADHFAAIESDLGCDHPLGFAIKGKLELQALLAPVAGVLDSQGSGLTRMTDETEADIGPLADAGVPSFNPIQDSRFYFNYHHTAADTLDKVDPRHLAENAAVMSVLAAALADLDTPLPR